MANAYPAIALVAHDNDPQRIKSLADAVCDGIDDGATINTWLANVQADGGGLVQLTDAAFSIDTVPVRVRRKVDLAGSQWAATVLQGGSGTWNAHDGSSPGAVVEPVDDHQDRVGLRDLTIAGGSGSLKGLYARVAANTGFVYGDDSRWLIERVFIRGTKSHGFDVGGAYCREWDISNLHVFDLVTGTSHGVYFDGNDSTLRAVRVGAVTGEGLYVNGPNNNLIGCKAYYADENGIRITGVRNRLTACEAQDNLKNGLLVDTAAYHTHVNGFLADSNSYDGSPSGGITGRTYHGIRVLAGATVIASGVALDKNEGARGLRQVYGWSLASGLVRCNLVGSSNDNFTGMVQVEAPGTAPTFSFIRIVGSQGDVSSSYVTNP